MNINSAIITGTVREDNYSHTAHDLEFRELIVETRRRSNVKDTVKVIYQEKEQRFNEGQRIMVSGSLRSRRENNKLDIYLYAEEIEEYSGEETNELILEGNICSEPYYKEVSGRKLTQFLICTENKRRSYVSVLVWKKKNLQLGQKVTICGRLQSRTYKQGNTDRKINEISAYRIN